MKISRKRKQVLMCEALAYAGELVRQVVNTYTAFDNLPEDERAFIDEYIVSIGARLIAQADQRNADAVVCARRLLRTLEQTRQTKKESSSP